VEVTVLSQDSMYASKPYSAAREQQLSAFLAEWTSTPADEIRRMPPPVPNVGTSAKPRYGYAVYPQRVLRIEDIARLDDLYPRTDNSGRRSGPGPTPPAVRGVM
jgi:hypothetical protein